jgi:hypothetical protein
MIGSSNLVRVPLTAGLVLLLIVGIGIGIYSVLSGSGFSKDLEIAVERPLAEEPGDFFMWPPDGHSIAFKDETRRIWIAELKK